MSIRCNSVKLYQEGEKGKEKGKRKGRGREREESRTSDLMGQYVRTRRQVAQWTCSEICSTQAGRPYCGLESRRTTPSSHVVGSSSFAGTLKGVSAKYHGEMERVEGGYEEIHLSLKKSRTSGVLAKGVRRLNINNE